MMEKKIFFRKSLIYQLTTINWNSPFPILGVLVVFYHFTQILMEDYVSKQ